MKNDIKVNTGDGTTYLTGGTVGGQQVLQSTFRLVRTTPPISTPMKRISRYSPSSSSTRIPSRAPLTRSRMWTTGTASRRWTATRSATPCAKANPLPIIPTFRRNAWYYKAADYVTKNGLLSGDKAYTFGASKALTRAQVAQALYNLAGQPKTELTDSFQRCSGNASGLHRLSRGRKRLASWRASAAAKVLAGPQRHPSGRPQRC